MAQRLVGLGYKLMAHRFQAPFCEVDLIFKNESQEWVLIEVKTLRNWAWMENRISLIQQARLIRSTQWFQSQQQKSVHLAAAFVVKEKIIFSLISELI